MYIPAHFDEPRTEAMHALIRARPFATLVTRSAAGLDADHIPLHLSAEEGPYGTLRGHVARANPVWEHAAEDPEALAIFHGPDSYISPGWYPTKKEHGKVVPTWNYAVVHARGSLRVTDDPAWLRAHLEALTAQHEAGFAEAWAVADAPPEFTERLLTKIVGIELVITGLAGKWKASQNQPPTVREGIVQGLEGLGGDRALEAAALIDTDQC